MSVDSWLAELGSAAPAPGGGAAAAVAAAMGAALVEMVCRLTSGRPAYGENEPLVRSTLEEAVRLRERALELAAADVAAFTALMDAYRLAKGEPDRAARIQDATEAAARVPLSTAAVAARVIQLAAELPGRSNPNVLSDVGVAASSAVAALESAAVNVAVNLAGLRDEATRAGLAAELAAHEAMLAPGRELASRVRAEVVR